MMMPMEDMPSQNPDCPTPTSDENVPGAEPPPSAVPSSPPPLNFRRLLCCGNQNNIPRHKIEPVIFQPLNDVYLQLKPRRRLRVIHLNCQGALPNPSPYYFQNSTNGEGGDDSDSDGEDYWFQNADPKRPKIKQPPASQPPKRIFHKLEPQVRPKFEELSPSNLANNIQGRLPRKTIKDVKENDDEEEEDDDMDQDHQGLKRNKNKKEESQSPSIKKEDPNLKEQLNESKEVLTLPEPGESSTDPDDANNDDHVVQNMDTSNTTASIKEAGQKLGGEANVAFESEEDDEYDHNDTPDTAIQSSVISHKMSENNDYSTSSTNNAQINQQQEPMHVLPALFFIHGVGGSANVWANQLSFFASLGHEVIAPDLLGHGFSSAPDKAKSYTFNKLLRDILTIFDHFIPRSRECIIVAHSYGCSMAAALARSRPESVKLLVMCSSGGPTPLCPPNQLSKVPPSLIGCLKPFLRCRFGAQSKKYRPKGKAAKIQEAFDVPSYVLHHIMMGQNWPEGDASYHRKISIPSLLVYGMKDPLVSLVEMCEMERTIPKAYLELIPLAGHMVMQDQPQDLNVMLKKFISKYFSN